MAVAAQVEEDRARHPFLLAAQRFLDGAQHRVVGLRRGHDAFGARELHACLEAPGLGVGARLDQPEFLHVAHERRHAVIA